MMTQMQVHLYRDSFTTPWGIRLQGGNDLTSPLLIQRVFPNTPAAGYLQRGDILLTLNGKDASGLTHKQAQDVFQFAGGQIPLVIRRANIESKNPPPPPKQQQHQQLYPPQVQPQQSKPQASSTVVKTRNRPTKTPSTTMAPTLKSSNTPLRKSKIESTKSAKGKPKQKVLGGGGFSFGVDYSKVEIQEDYVPGPIYNEEEQADDLDQSYRTVPLDLEGPTKMAHPHIPKGGMKYGGGGPNYGVSYIPPGGVQRQSSKPWEDTEMLHKVQDTLAHKSFPYQQVGSYNGGPPAHYQHVAPPAYVPGPPPSSDTSYVDPFPSYVPPKPSEDEEDDYEFLPVSQRRNQFNKQDFVSDTRKPIRSRSRPKTYHAPPPPPHTAPKPVIQPVYAPMSRPAEGEVILDETPAWAGTLSSASGAKLRDATYQPTTHHVSPTRSVSPSKKKGRKPPAPKPTQEFTPTKTQALDFSNDPDDGPRIMHLQYNSPLDMYSRENVQETLQGQTQAAIGGGNTASTTDSQDTDNVSVSQTVLHLGNPPTQQPDHRPPVPPKPVRHKVAAAAAEASNQDTQIHSVTPPLSPRPVTPTAPRPVTPTPLRQVTPPPPREGTPPREATPPHEATPPQPEQPMSRAARRRLAAKAQREALAAAQAQAQAQAQSIAEPVIQPPTMSVPAFTSPPPVTPKPPSFRPAPPPAPMRDLTSQSDPFKKKEEGDSSFIFRLAVFACLCAIIVCMIYMNRGTLFRGKVVESPLAVEEESVNGNAGPGFAPEKDITDEN